MEPWMPFEPGLYAGMLVGALIVEDQMGSSQAGVSSFSWGNGWTPDDDGAADQPDVEYTSSSYEETTQRNSQVYDLFLKEFGSVLCRDIQNNLFGKSYNVETAKEVSELNSLNRAVGFAVIAAAARLAATLVLERGLSNSSDTLRWKAIWRLR